MKLKKLAVTMVIVGLFSAGGAAYAGTLSTPAEITADLTGKTIEEVNKERTAGKTYGAIANDAGKLGEFKAQMVEEKKAILEQRVQEGKLSQEQADQIYNTMIINQENCDGTGGSRMGKNAGACFGQGNGRGLRMQNGRGLRMQNGRGMGLGRLGL